MNIMIGANKAHHPSFYVQNMAAVMAAILSFPADIPPPPDRNVWFSNIIPHRPLIKPTFPSCQDEESKMSLDKSRERGERVIFSPFLPTLKIWSSELLKNYFINISNGALGNTQSIPFLFIINTDSRNNKSYLLILHPDHRRCSSPDTSAVIHVADKNLLGGPCLERQGTGRLKYSSVELLSAAIP